jgi:predicted metal-binding protein
MEKILIIGCKKAMNDACIGCSRCLVGFNRREGEFARYKDVEVELIGLLNCGDCPGAITVTRMAQFNLWNKPMAEIPTKVHVAPCILDHCEYKDAVLYKIKAKAGVEVIEGTHPYMPNNIFQQQ